MEQRLLEQVAATFRNPIDGPNGFIRHETLRYSWIRYIPVDAIADNFWILLKDRLIVELRTSKVFYSMDGSN